MFLDEILENEYNAENKDKLLNRLLSVCVTALPQPESVPPTVFFDGVKKIDYSWQLFAKRHTDISPTLFRSYVLRCCKDEHINGIKEYLGW